MTLNIETPALDDDLRDDLACSILERQRMVTSLDVLQNRHRAIVARGEGDGIFPGLIVDESLRDERPLGKGREICLSCY